MGICCASDESWGPKNNIKVTFPAINPEGFILLFPLYKPIISQNFYAGVKI
jgi:hypothetical protein